MEKTQKPGLKQAVEALIDGSACPADALGIPKRIVDGMYTLATDALGRGRTKDAAALFQRCLQLDPRRTEFWLGFAAAKQAEGELEEAGEIFQLAAMFGTDSSAMAYAAACFAEAGKHERALILAEHVRSTMTDTSALEPWLAVAESSVGGAR
ncbi:MAG: tetratricopeptide repeat protein [Myxococcales bacterium]|nr:tetratricopeptide repeat protein [Myxococcales bacterium]